MNVAEWNSYIESLKVNMTKIYDECMEDIDNVVKESARFNPAESIFRKCSMSEKIAEITSKANHAAIGMLYDAINNAKSIASATNNDEIVGVIARLQMMLQVATTNNNEATADKKKTVSDNMNERRYMWQFYQDNVYHAKINGLIDAGVIDDIGDQFNLFNDLIDISEYACDLYVGEAGTIEMGVYDRLLRLDRYAKENKLRDNLDIERMEIMKESLFVPVSNEDGSIRYESRYTFNTDGIEDEKVKSCIENIKKDHDLVLAVMNGEGEYADKALLNSRHEVLMPVYERIVHNYNMYEKLTENKKIDNTTHKNIEKFAKSVAFASKIDASREAHIDASNAIHEARENVLANEEKLKEIHLTEEEKAKAFEEIQEYLKGVQSKECDSEYMYSSFLDKYKSVRNNYKDYIMNYINNIYNSKISEDAINKIKEARENTYKAVVETYAVDFAQKTINKDIVLEMFGGEEAIRKELLNSKGLLSDSLESIRNGADLFSESSLFVTDHGKLSDKAAAFIGYANLIRNNNEVIKIYNDIKEKGRVEDEDIEKIVLTFVKCRGALERIADAKMSEPVKEFNNVLKIIIDSISLDETQLDKHIALHKEIMSKVPKELTHVKELMKQDKEKDKNKKKDKAKDKKKDKKKDKAKDKEKDKDKDKKKDKEKDKKKQN